MSLAPEVLDALLAAGASAEMIVAAVKADAAKAEQRRDRQRAGNAERQRRHRASNAASRVTGVTNGDERDEAPAFDKETSPRPPKEIKSTPGVIPATREEPVSIEHPANAIVAGWLAIFTVTAAHRRKRWKKMPPPAGVSDAQWVGFLGHRKAKRQSLTDHAYALLVNKLTKHADDEWPPGRIIDHIIDRGWLTFEPAWLTNSTEQRNGQRSHHNRSEIRNPLVAACVADVARRAGDGPGDVDAFSE